MLLVLMLVAAPLIAQEITAVSLPRFGGHFGAASY
jgi:hypothetical protein